MKQYTIGHILLACLFGSLTGCDLQSPTLTTAAWKVELGTSYANVSGATPATDGSRFFAASRTGIDAFDATTGRRLWYTGGLGGAEVAIALLARGGRVVAPGDRVAALDTQSGAVAWSFLPDSTASLTYGDADAEMVYVGDYGRNVYALDAATGALRWRVNVATPEWGRFGFNPIRSTTVGGDTLYVGAERKYTENGFYTAGVVVALDRRTGRELWRHQEGGATGLHGVGGNVAVSGPWLVYADLRGKAYVALRRVDGSVAWRFNTEPNFAGPQATPQVENGIVYGAAVDGRVYAIDLASGRVRWTARPQPGSYYHNALCGRAVLANQLGIAVLDKTSGQQIARFSDGESDFATSGFAVAGTRAFFLTRKHAVAIDCPV